MQMHKRSNDVDSFIALRRIKTQLLANKPRGKKTQTERKLDG